MHQRIERFTKTKQKTRQKGEHLLQLVCSTKSALIIPGDELGIATIVIVTGSMKVQSVEDNVCNRLWQKWRLIQKNLKSGLEVEENRPTH